MKDLTFHAVAGVHKRKGHGLTGFVLQLPESIVERYRYKYWLIYGNSCYYCIDREHALSICREHGWDAISYDE